MADHTASLSNDGILSFDKNNLKNCDVTLYHSYHFCQVLPNHVTWFLREMTTLINAVSEARERQMFAWNMKILQGIATLKKCTRKLEIIMISLIDFVYFSVSLLVILLLATLKALFVSCIIGYSPSDTLIKSL